ncbi:hypothetical protein FIA58_004930 [Flavobacterium jejuense]|uniref:Uncharacterized protein n=1 Tax=Flavobacterium jejuense TaxID=1544455 RepID=A0ABX0IQ21_9FLAO|nr:hypothetical protein [Flavobacterium jejuense]NHN25017.1 hypothetical protein [Flavobacterium jejuense]
MMDFEYYIEKFQKAANQLDKKKRTAKQLQMHVGVTLNSVVLKLYKKEWTNDEIDPVNATTRIFFAVWVNEESIKKNKIFYNIHALKLRKLSGYAIESKKFATSFRNEFKKQEVNWQNVSTNFGPLTLMEGWIKLDNDKAQEDIVALANNFMSIAYLIDKTLAEFKK